MGNALTLEQLARLPPTIVGTIHWKSSAGVPAGDLRSGFSIRVEEHTASQFRDAGGGHYEKIPGTGIWKDVPADSVLLRPGTTEGNDCSVSFTVTGLHLNAFPDGKYRITPVLKGDWRPSGMLAALGHRDIEPTSMSVGLEKDHPLKSMDFEVVRRSNFSGRRLNT